MFANVVAKGLSYYVEFIYQGAVYDEAGPFDEEWEADECVSTWEDYIR